MPGPRWTTEAQYEFLDSRLKEYLEAQDVKGPRYTNFWASLYEDWARQYPENTVLFPEKLIADYTPDETQLLKRAIKARRQQLQTWFRWRGTTRARGTVKQSKVFSKLFTTSRLPQKAEIYSKICYEDKIKAVVKEEAERLNIKGRGDILKLRGEITRRMCDEEQDEEIKARVEAEMQAVITRRELALESRERSNDQIQEAIDDCSAVLNRFLTALSEKTGWAFSVLMGGPDPSRGGDITVASFHAGETGIDNEFGHAHPNFEKVYMEPFTDYLRQLYPSSLRSSRSLDAKSQEFDANGDSQEDVRDGMVLLAKSDMEDIESTFDILSKSSSSTVDDALNGSITPFPAVSPPASPPALATTAASTITPVPVTPPSNPALGTTAASTVTPVPVTPPSSQAQPGLATVTNASPAHPTCPADPQLATSSPSDHPAHSFSTPPAPTPDAATTDMSFLNQDQDLLAALLDGLGGNGEDTNAGPDNYQFTPQFAADFAWMQPFNYSGYDASTLTIPHASSTLPGLSGLFDDIPYPDVTMSNLGIPTLPDLSHNTPLPPVLPPSPSLPSPTAPPSTHISAPEPLSDPTPVLMNASQLALLTPSASGNHADPDASSSKQARSRSGRQIIPSTRADVMNKIGSAQTLSLDLANKENVPPGTEQERPAWAVAAEAHLTTRDLGDGWAKCVSAWKAFEDAMGPNAKGALPSAKTRPEEWTKWVAKGRQGVRAYHATPTIQDPLDFGYAVMAWWKSMQPAFRQSSELMPKPVYDPPELDVSNVDEWAALRKGGPNGVVSVLTVLVWWGQCLRTGSQWQENSEPYWRACVNDVHQCLGKLMPSVSGQKRTRGAKDGASGSSKRGDHRNVLHRPVVLSATLQRLLLLEGVPFWVELRACDPIIAGAALHSEEWNAPTRLIYASRPPTAPTRTSGLSQGYFTFSLHKSDVTSMPPPPPPFPT
ncbi:hypothetical protein FPV67DRAFT_1669174 [Lyophyllum atratum]|nr:hypothetical protein FPV67DRAFT_1669174 [Lyophyllum atratum]